MKTFAFLFIVLAAAFFVLGGVTVWLGWFDISMYALIGGVVGSTASIAGLIAFISPKLTDKDVLAVDSKLVQRLAETTASLQEYEERLSEDKEDLARLHRDRLEIEALVRQASVKVFFEEKVARLSIEIEERVSRDRALSELLYEYDNIKGVAAKIDATINESEQAELIKEVLRDLEARRTQIELTIGGISLGISPALRFSDAVTRALVDALTVLRK